MKEWINKKLLERFERLHGKGAPHQAQLYRCTDCRKLITWRKIQVGDVCCRGRVSPTDPRWFEKIRLMAFS